jgi:hypothetical protein
VDNDNAWRASTHASLAIGIALIPNDLPDLPNRPVAYGRVRDLHARKMPGSIEEEDGLILQQIYVRPGEVFAVEVHRELVERKGRLPRRGPAVPVHILEHVRRCARLSVWVRSSGGHGGWVESIGR